MAGDMVAWLMGIEGAMLATEDRPELLHALLEVIEEWDRKRTALVLHQGVDLFIRRGWYENADFWSPARYRELLFPGLRRCAEQVHAAGAKMGYIMSCSLLPLVEQMVEAGVDVLLGIDPAQDRSMDFGKLKSATKNRMALWGGVCGYLTVELGSRDDVGRQVRDAIRLLAPGGGFILAPVTNVRAGTKRAWENVDALVQAWRNSRAYPVAARPRREAT
jgi:uroporphyrinogen decarboxylase